MPHDLIHHLQYNRWANERIGHLLIAQDDAILKNEQMSSFSSINKTLLHIWDAEIIWLTRLKGGSISDWPSKSFVGSTTEMLHGLVNTSNDFIQFIESKDASFLGEPLSYKNMKGDSFENTPEEILFHLVNHGTYHRGQIITLLHANGIHQVVSTDLIAWFREQKNK